MTRDSDFKCDSMSESQHGFDRNGKNNVIKITKICPTLVCYFSQVRIKLSVSKLYKAIQILLVQVLQLVLLKLLSYIHSTRSRLFMFHSKLALSCSAYQTKIVVNMMMHFLFLYSKKYKIPR